MATIVEGDQKAPFSIATTPRCKGGHYSFPGLFHLPSIRTLYCWALSKAVSSTIFKVFGMRRPGIESRSPRSLANGIQLMMLQILWWASYLIYLIFVRFTRIIMLSLSGWLTKSHVFQVLQLTWLVIGRTLSWLECTSHQQNRNDVSLFRT